MEEAIQAIGQALNMASFWAPLLLPVLFYCLPHFPNTPGRAKQRIILALAAIVVIAEADYGWAWASYHLMPNPSFVAVLGIMGTGPIAAPVFAILGSVFGFLPVMVLYFRKTGFRDFDSTVESRGE